MAIQLFDQYFYCEDGSASNHYPIEAVDESIGLTRNSLVTGDAFRGILPCQQIGVQAPPGTMFYLNTRSTPIIVGFTGALSIDLSNGGSISDISFDAKSIDIIKENPSLFLIVDIIRNIPTD